MAYNNNNNNNNNNKHFLLALGGDKRQIHWLHVSAVDEAGIICVDVGVGYLIQVPCLSGGGLRCVYR